MDERHLQILSSSIQPGAIQSLVTKSLLTPAIKEQSLSASISSYFSMVSSDGNDNNELMVCTRTTGFLSLDYRIVWLFFFFLQKEDMWSGLSKCFPGKFPQIWHVPWNQGKGQREARCEMQGRGAALHEQDEERISIASPTAYLTYRWVSPVLPVSPRDFRVYFSG